MKPRHLILGIALACTFAATAWLAAEEDPLTAPPKKRPASAEVPRGGSRAADGRGPRLPVEEKLALPAPEALTREPFALASGNLFAVRDWQPPPPPQPRPKPSAPPLPFRYQGQLLEGEQTLVFLGAGDRTLLARSGDTLEGQYRIESVGAGSIVFLYQPLNERQSLTIGRTH